jgi:hypothetical protein
MELAVWLIPDAADHCPFLNEIEEYAPVSCGHSRGSSRCAILFQGAQRAAWAASFCRFYAACAKDPEYSSASFVAERAGTFHITLCDFAPLDAGAGGMSRQMQAVGDALRAAAIACINDKVRCRTRASASCPR